MHAMATQRDLQLLEAQRLTDQVSVLWSVGSYPGTEPLCRRALKLTRAAVGDRDPRVAERLYNLATLYHLQRRFEEAKPLYRESIFIHESQRAPDRQALAFCLAWLARTLVEAWREDPGVDASEEGRSFIEAEECYRRALELLEGLNADDSAEYAGCLMQLGFLYFYCDRFREAEPLYRRALNMCENLFGTDHLETAEAAGRLAMLYWQDRDSGTDPEPLLRRSLQIRCGQLEPTDPEIWEWTFRLAEYYRASGRDAESEELYERLGDLLLDEATPLHDEVDWIVSGYLDYLLETGQVDLAAAIDARWNAESPSLRRRRLKLKRAETMLGPDHSLVAVSLCDLADDLRLDERYTEAEPLYRRALAISERAGESNKAAALPVLNGLASMLRAQDKTEEAKELLERARRIPFERDQPGERKQHARALEQLAWVSSIQDRGENAEALFRSAIALVAAAPCDYREIAEMQYRRSIFYSQDGRHARAEDCVLAALDAAAQTDGLDALEVADFREQYAAVLEALGKTQDAERERAEVRRIWADAGAPRDDLLSLRG